MGFELLDGRAHSEEFGADSTRLLINETAAEVMGLENPVGEQITLWGDEVEIIGLVKDFHFQTLRSEITPLFLNSLNTAQPHMFGSLQRTFKVR